MGGVQKAGSLEKALRLIKAGAQRSGNKRGNKSPAKRTTIFFSHGQMVSVKTEESALLFQSLRVTAEKKYRYSSALFCETGVEEWELLRH